MSWDDPPWPLRSACRRVYCAIHLLPATFPVMNRLGRPLHRTVLLTTTNPALASGLPDRGEIHIGKRADLIAVRSREEIPVVQHLWSRGRLVLRIS